MLVVVCSLRYIINAYEIFLFIKIELFFVNNDHKSVFSIFVKEYKKEKLL